MARHQWENWKLLLSKHVYSQETIYTLDEDNWKNKMEFYLNSPGYIDKIMNLTLISNFK